MVTVLEAVAVAAFPDKFAFCGEFEDANGALFIGEACVVGSDV